jgi:putative transposase
VTRYRFIHANRAEFGVRRCCRAVGVSPASFYDWHRRGPSARQRADQRLLGQISKLHRQSGGAYGAPRIHAELQIACGVCCGRKRVARLMRSAGLVGCHRRRRFRPGLTRRDPRAAPAPDLCHRQCSPPQPNRLWHADYTELPTDQGPLYLVAIVDGCSRVAVGHAMGERATAELAIAAVELGSAAARSTPTAGLSITPIRAASSQPGVREAAGGAGDPRVDGLVGDCFDHAFIESFFATLECELIDRRHWHTREEARLEVFWWLEAVDDRRRRHSSLGYLSPMEYEANLSMTTSHNDPSK